MSTCERLQEQLNSFLDGELDAAHAVSLSAHLEECPECRRELVALKATQTLLRSAPVPDGRQAQRQALATFRNSSTAERPVPRSRPVWQGVLASAAATAVLAAVMYHYTVQPGLQLPLPETNRMVATTLGANGLPTSDELDEMTSLHAAQSFAVPAGDDGIQQTTLADANSRLSLRKP
jgi:anti-sigma factor RsiW